MVNIAINGMGRIGKNIIRSIMQNPRPGINLIAINSPSDIKTNVHLLKYDSINGIFLGDISCDDEDYLYINGQKIKLFREKNPEMIAWDEVKVDIVLECSGKFNQKSDAIKHLKSGVKKVLVSAPCKDADKTIVFGVNNNMLTSEDVVISAGSCTTNCLAPVAKILNDNLGIENGFMTTIHAYTNDQSVLDCSHKDLRRARACALSMIPTSTGAAKAIGEVIPELQGKLAGGAVRVPTPNVSFIDFTFNSQKDTSVEEINALFKQAANSSLKNVLDVCDEPLVSIDFNQNPHSAIVDSALTNVNGRLCKVSAWYDNEWAFSLRMLDIISILK